jgi:hypothetical protein
MKERFLEIKPNHTIAWFQLSMLYQVGISEKPRLIPPIDNDVAAANLILRGEYGKMVALKGNNIVSQEIGAAMHSMK